MESPAVASNAIREASHSHPSRRPAAYFLVRYPARVRRMRAQVEDERALLLLALTAFQAELAAEVD